MINEFSCGAVVYKVEENETKYLIIKQRYTNHYGFPKGHMEKNETKEETAIREVLEETGINVELNVNRFEVIYYEPRPNIKKEVTYFLAKAINYNAIYQVEEVLEVLWLNEIDVLKILTYDNDKEIFNKLK